MENTRDTPGIQDWKNAEMEKCPFCGFEYQHPARVEVEPVVGAILVSITDSGVETKLTDSAQKIRGVVIRLRFDGECGHVWERVWQFHKGYTYVENHLLSTTPDGAELTLETIWSD